jgi:hypothetical protein
VESDVTTIITDFAPPSVLQLRDASADKEADFETMALRILRVSYPNCSVFPFHPVVSFEGARWRPDLAIVENSHRYWFILEVETANHHLEKHVIPQAMAFAEGTYGDDAIQTLARELDLTEEAAATFLNYIPRYVAVVSNRLDDLWTKKLNSINVQHIAISSYHSATTNQTAHLVDGLLIPAEESLGFGRVRATDKAIITRAQEFWDDGELQVIGPEGLNTWTCTTIGKQVWLMKKAGLIEFPDTSIIQILRRWDGSLLFRLPYNL